jgi:hypothetical protein
MIPFLIFSVKFFGNHSFLSDHLAGNIENLENGYPIDFLALRPYPEGK